MPEKPVRDGWPIGRRLWCPEHSESVWNTSRYMTKWARVVCARFRPMRFVRGGQSPLRRHAPNARTRKIARFLKNTQCKWETVRTTRRKPLFEVDEDLSRPYNPGVCQNAQTDDEFWGEGLCVLQGYLDSGPGLTTAPEGILQAKLERVSLSRSIRARASTPDTPAFNAFMMAASVSRLLPRMLALTTCTQAASKMRAPR
jgi:hypothetical protein